MARLTDGDRLELLFSGRDAAGRSHIGRAIASWRGDSVALDSVELEPLLSPGTLGVFDDSGVTVSSLVESEGLQLLYYTGWSLGRTVPFYLCAGLAVSEDGGLTFHRHSLAPLLERTSVDPLLTASPFVMNDGGVWRMWYVSGVDWHLRDGQPEHRYHIKYAESSDGFSWRRDGTVSVDLEGTECALGRPWVIRRGNRYLMWFSSRGDGYRLGYAESTDGVHWQRCDSAVGIAPDPAGWDSAMTYPCVLTEGSRWLLLYNGSGYGETGIGYAHGREEPA